MKKLIAALMTVLFLGSTTGLVLAQTPTTASTTPVAKVVKKHKSHKESEEDGRSGRCDQYGEQVIRRVLQTATSAVFFKAPFPRESQGLFYFHSQMPKNEFPIFCQT